MNFEEFEKNHPELCYSDAVNAYNGVYFKENAKIGDGATIFLWPDREAYTIIKRTPCTLTLRRCKATLKPEWEPIWYEGCFVGHCVNQNEQDYTYEEDENGSVVTVHWSNKWKHFRNGTCNVIPGRREFYDYNFSSNRRAKLFFNFLNFAY